LDVASLLTLTRGPSTDEGTFGGATLVTDTGSASFDTLELPWRGNAPGKSCIVLSTYKAVVVNSPHFGFPVYQLQFVPGRTAVDIHPANWAGDVTKGLYSDLLGCIALGHGTGPLAAPGHPTPQKALLHSRVAFDEMMALTAGAPLTVRIVGFGVVGPYA
jgi:Family of unknown function (DUF5675)